MNNAFYRLPERSVFARWRERDPAGFVMAVKVSRYLTHIRRLRDPAEPVARLATGRRAWATGWARTCCSCRRRCGPTPALLDACLAAFPRAARVAVEPRHASWWTDEVRAVLERRRAALCWADRRGRPVTPLWRTADWGYVRLHEGTASPRPSLRPGGAGDVARPDRRRVVARGADVYVYFNNDRGRRRRPQRPHPLPPGGRP